METVKKLRGATWVAFLLEKGEFKSLAELHRSLDVVNDVQLWSAYKRGKASPQESTVKLVDRVVPGAASTWFNGLHDLPLWAVLEGDIAVCQQVVSDLLNAYVGADHWMSLARRPVASMGDTERLKALLEVVLPKSLWQLPTSLMRYNPNEPHNMELTGWLSLSELFGRVENPLTILYRQDKLKAKEKNIIQSFVYGMVAKLGGPQAIASKSASNLTNPAYVLAFIALVQICNESRDKALSLAPEFLKQGIKESVIDSFDSDVALFIETM